MRRAVRFFNAHAAGGGGGATPYQVVLKAVEHDGHGLLAAAEVFKQFQRFYKSYQHEEQLRMKLDGTTASSTSASRRDLSDERGGATATGGVIAASARPISRPLPGKPLTQFCGRAEEVEPLTVLLLKVLCDLQKLEEMRFLFTQCLLELDDRTPSVELLNVFLLAISMTDTFNQYEVENLVELQQAKRMVPDIVTKLSMFVLYLRLGHQGCDVWWPGIREEVEVILEAGAVDRYPLLPLRLQHCFETLLRVHHDTRVIHESFQLLHRASPQRVTPPLVLPYILLCALNTSAPPSAVVEVLKIVEAQQQAVAAPSVAQQDTAAPRQEDAAAVAGASTAGPSRSASYSEKTTEPLLSSEITIFRLLAKCAKYGDADAAAFLRAYIRSYSRYALVAKGNEPVASLLYVEVLARCGRIRAALRVLETEVPPPYHRPGERPKLFLQSRRLSLLSSDPVQHVVQALTPLVAATHVKDPVLMLVAAKPTAEADEERDPVPVSAVTLDLFIAACELSGGAARAEEILRLYPRYDAHPSAATYTLLLRVYSATAPVDGALRLPSMEREMKAAGIVVDSAWLHAAMDVALAARDVGTAFRVAELNVTHACSVDAKHGVRLLRELAGNANADGILMALNVLRASKSPIDSRSVTLCKAVLQSVGLPNASLDDSATSPPIGVRVGLPLPP